MTKLDRFQWDLLGDLVLEDERGLTEIYWQARTMFEGDSPDEQRAIARDALLKLLDEGLIEFYDKDIEAVSLSKPIAQELINGSDWFAGTPSRQILQVFVRATPAGERAVQNPPPDIAQLWKGGE